MITGTIKIISAKINKMFKIFSNTSIFKLDIIGLYLKELSDTIILYIQ